MKVWAGDPGHTANVAAAAALGQSKEGECAAGRGRSEQGGRSTGK